MAVQIDILQQVLEVFRVQEFASQYSSTLDKFLYSIFFPMILLLLLIYILSARMFPNHKGLSVLLGVSFLIFIVVYPPESDYSLYSAFAPIGQVWYAFVIIIGVLWVLLSHIFPSDRSAGFQGARSGRSPAVLEREDVSEGLIKKAKKAYEKTSGKIAKQLERQITTNLAYMENMINTKRAAGRNSKEIADLIKEFNNLRSEALAMIARLDNMSEMEKAYLQRNPEQYELEVNRITRDFSRA
ncbi:MAG: hypothetical protein HY512_01130 [Candidatus Aenigmarchaeota archaeon]|nr:hypothetical protein [Candidatus Aenigmarchaeota archaeon]